MREEKKYMSNYRWQGKYLNCMTYLLIYLVREGEPKI